MEPPPGPDGALAAWLQDGTNRMLLVLAAALLSGVGSLVSFVAREGPGGPSTLEIGLLLLSLSLTFYLAVQNSA